MFFKKSIKIALTALFAINLAHSIEFEGKYIRLENPLSNAQQSVIEVFSYKCIHCFNHHRFDTLAKLKQKFPEFSFELFPVSSFHAEFGARINEFFAFAKAKDEAAKKDAGSKNNLTHRLADALFSTHFVNRKEISSRTELDKIALKALDAKISEIDEFLKTPKAKELLKRFDFANEVAKTYGTPAFVVNGKYQIKPEALTSMQALSDLVENLSKK